tara:strand:+ start:1729 stop:2130 length:402 start_codon:yes stop_codon:yes gene_type:complete
LGNKLSCKYLANPGSGASYAGLAITGRAVLHSIITCNPETNGGGTPLTDTTASDRTIITLKDGTTSAGEVMMKFVNTMNGDIRVGHHDYTPWGGDVILDIPSPGILFENGIFAELHNGCTGISLIVSGASTTP